MVIVIPLDDLATVEELTDVADPDLGFALVVDDDFVPCLRLLLDSFPVAAPADVSEIDRQHVQLLGELRDRRHPDLIDQGKPDAVLAEKIEERLCEPILVADLDGVAVGARQTLKISREPLQERIAIRHGFLAEARELQQ